MNKIRKKYIYIPIIVVIIIIVFGGGFFLGKKSIPRPSVYDRIFFNKELGKPEVIDFSIFWEALRKLEDKYVDSSKIDYQQILYGAISGMTESLGDDYTVFMKPEKAKSFFESVSGTESFEGVGMELGIKGKILTVIAPLEGTPAYRAGIQAGDKILKIDDRTTEGMQVEEAVSLIRGKRGTQVTLTISRKTFDQPKDFTLTRDIINVPVVRWELIENNIAYIKIYQFSEKASADFRKAALEILASPAKKIILDLRNNPGGYLEIAQEISGWFLEKGQIVVIEDFGSKKEKIEYKAEGNAKLAKYPIVILINQGSASGSEILAGALRDNRGVLLIGEKSFGKGSVQQLEKLKEGSSLKITIARWLTPKGELITDKGLEPDIKVEITEQDEQEGKDPQLEKAIEIIKNL